MVGTGAALHRGEQPITPGWASVVGVASVAERTVPLAAGVLSQVE